MSFSATTSFLPTIVNVTDAVLSGSQTTFAAGFAVSGSTVKVSGSLI